MAEKTINSRIVHKHDTEANWRKATNFIPKVAEIIIYDIDDFYACPRWKIGDGITPVNDLPFEYSAPSVCATVTTDYGETVSAAKPNWIDWPSIDVRDYNIYYLENGMIYTIPYDSIIIQENGLTIFLGEDDYPVAFFANEIGTFTIDNDSYGMASITLPEYCLYFLQGPFRWIDNFWLEPINAENYASVSVEANDDYNPKGYLLIDKSTDTADAWVDNTVTIDFQTYQSTTVYLNQADLTLDGNISWLSYGDIPPVIVVQEPGTYTIDTRANIYTIECPQKGIYICKDTLHPHWIVKELNYKAKAGTNLGEVKSGGDAIIEDGIIAINDNYVAPKADKLSTARTISLTGAVTGSASFDGSSNITITTTSDSASSASDNIYAATMTSAGAINITTNGAVNTNYTDGNTVKIYFTSAPTQNVTLTGFYIDGTKVGYDIYALDPSQNYPSKVNSSFFKPYSIYELTFMSNFGNNWMITNHEFGGAEYTLPAAGTDLGGVKTGGDVTITDGVISVNDDSHNHTIANVDGLQDVLDAKANYQHIALKDYTGSGSPLWYYELCTCAIDNYANAGHFHFKGKIGGHLFHNQAAVVDVTLSNRTGGYTGDGVYASVAASGASLAQMANYADIIVMSQDNLSAKVYLVCKGYFLVDLDYDAYQYSLTFDADNKLTTTPTGTEIWRLSTAVCTSTNLSGQIITPGAYEGSVDYNNKYMTRSQVLALIQEQITNNSASIATNYNDTVTVNEEW